MHVDASDFSRADGNSKLRASVLKFCLSASAAAVAETVTFPLDLTKTRLQVQGELNITSTGAAGGSHIRRGMLTTAAGIVREEGAFKLWQGVTPAIYRHVVYTGGRMGSYEFIRENVLGKNADGTFALWKAIVAGATAGALGQFAASPADLVKVQMQMEGRRILEGKPPRIKSTLQAFVKIYTEGGVRGLWKGWAPNVQRAALVNMGDLATYDTVKQHLLSNTSLTDNYVTHIIASAASGLVAAIVSTPADVVKTRIMNQPTNEAGRGLVYSSSYDCLSKTVKAEGFFALYKGFVPIYIRMAPWSLVFWLSYEKIRHITGVGGF